MVEKKIKRKYVWHMKIIKFKCQYPLIVLLSYLCQKKKKILAPESHLRSIENGSGLGMGRRGLGYQLFFKSFPDTM